jgi:hypothetical protein
MDKDMDAITRAAVAPFLRPGEQINGVGFASNVVPMFARLIPILRHFYVGHHMVVGTNQRLLLVPVSLTLMMGVPDQVHLPPKVLEFGALASATPFSPTIIGHKALRLTRKDSISHEIMWPGTKDRVPGQQGFFGSFPSWLQNTLTQGGFPPPPPPDPRTPEFPPPPMAMHTYLMVLGAVAAVFFFVMVIAGMLSPIRPLAISLGVAGAGIAATAFLDKKNRAQLLAMPWPQRVQFAQQKYAGKAPKSLMRWALLAGIVMLPVSCVGQQLAFMASTSGDGPSSVKTSAKPLRPATKPWSTTDTEPKPSEPKPSEPKPTAAVPTTVAPSSLIGKSVRAIWPKDLKSYPGTITKVYGRYIFVKLADGASLWTDVAIVIPVQSPAAEPADPDCEFVGARVKAPYSTDRKTRYPGKIGVVYHQLVRVDFDDRDVGWAECKELAK